MDTRHLIDPELLPFVDTFPPLATTIERLRELRALFPIDHVVSVHPHDLAEKVEFQNLTCPGPAGAPDVRVLLYRPRCCDAVKPALIYLHGGGYVQGSAYYTHDRIMRLSAKLGCVVAAVEYRLAPETRHPGPIEDCYAVLLWLKENAGWINFDARRVGVMGESAGGGLAAALALLARDRGQPLAFQILIYPMLDDRSVTTTHSSPCAGQFVWTRHNNRFGWSALLGDQPGAEDVEPYAAAARAPDLSSLPPAFIAVGSLDLFVDEDVAYAMRLTHAGVPTELHLYAGAVHGFIMAPETRLGRQLYRDYEAALDVFLRPTREVVP